MLEDTSNTASIGDINAKLGYGYVWQEPEIADQCGSTYMVKAKSGGAHSVIKGIHEMATQSQCSDAGARR